MLSIVCVSQLFFGNIYAECTVQQQEESTICGVPAEGFSLMTDFMQEMLQAIKTIGTRDPYIGQYVSPSRFEAGAFVPPKEGLVQKMEKNVWQKMNAVIAVTSVFTNLGDRGGVKDVFGGLLILRRNKVFFRDYKTLMEMDGLINDKKYELGLGGAWFTQLNEANHAQFVSILQKYKDAGLLDDASAIKISATYKQIILMVVRINSALKTFMSVDSTRAFTSEFTREKLSSDTPEFFLMFSPQMINEMDDEYDCARGLTKCDTSLKEAGESLSKIGTTAGSGAQESWKIIQKSLKELRMAFFPGSKKNDAPELDAFKKKQAEQLRSFKGLDAMPTGGFMGLKNYRKLRSTIKQQATGTREAIAKDFTGDNAILDFTKQYELSNEKRKERVADAEKEIAKIKKQLKDGEKMEPKTEAMSNLLHDQNNDLDLDVSAYDDIATSMKDIWNRASAANESAVISDNMDVTYQLYSILSTLSILINDVIGSREVDNSLIKNFGEACQEQCKNAGGECFYKL